MNKLYLYQAINLNGELIEDSKIASKKEDIIELLFENELHPISIQFTRFISNKIWQGEHQILFIRQLATLLQAGLPIINALDMIANEHPQLPWRCLLKDVSKNVINGKQLSEALAIYPSVFPTIAIQMIAIGELTGELSNACQRLADMQEKQQALQKSLKKALRYPLIVCTIAIMVTVLMLLFVLPQFASIYDSFDAELPWFTQLLLNLSDFLAQYLFLIICFFFIVIQLNKILFKRYPILLSKQQDLRLKLPIVGELIRFGVLNQLFSTLSMTQKAGISLIDGLDATAKTLNMPCYSNTVRIIHEKITQGLLFNQAISLPEIAHFFPSICQQLIKVGEETGNLDELLQKLATWHHQKAEDKAQKITESVEPFMMLIIGTIVGGLVLAMYLPIFQMGNIMN